MTVTLLSWFVPYLPCMPCDGQAAAGGGGSGGSADGFASNMDGQAERRDVRFTRCIWLHMRGTQRHAVSPFRRSSFGVRPVRLPSDLRRERSRLSSQVLTMIGWRPEQDHASQMGRWKLTSPSSHCLQGTEDAERKVEVRCLDKNPASQGAAG